MDWSIWFVAAQGNYMSNYIVNAIILWLQDVSVNTEENCYSVFILWGIIDVTLWEEEANHASGYF